MHVFFASSRYSGCVLPTACVCVDGCVGVACEGVMMLKSLVWCDASCCSVLQCVAGSNNVCSSELWSTILISIRIVAVCCSVLQRVAESHDVSTWEQWSAMLISICYRSALKHVEVCWECAAVCCSVLQCAAVCCSVFQCAAALFSMFQRVIVCCSVLQRDAVISLESEKYHVLFQGSHIASRM